VCICVCACVFVCCGCAFICVCVGVRACQRSAIRNKCVVGVRVNV